MCPSCPAPVLLKGDAMARQGLPDSEFQQLDIIRKIWRDLAKDGATSSLIGIAQAHSEIHQGKSFTASFTAEIGDGVEQFVRFSTPSTTLRAHMVLSIRGALAATVFLYEDTDYLHDAASVLPAHNRDRNSVNTAEMVLSTSPSSSGQGTEIWASGWGAAGQGNFPGSGGGERGINEWLLKGDTAYLLRFVSGAASNRIAIELDWYERIRIR